MSVIRKKPYIEKVIAILSAEKLSALKNILDTGGNNLSCGFANMPTYEAGDTSVTAVYFQLEPNVHKNGILLNNENYCTLIAYNRYQDIEIYDLDATNGTYKQVYEYCSIEELRRVLDDYQERGGDEWAAVMKDKMTYDEDTNTVEVGTNLYVDGMTKTDEIVSATEVGEENVGFAEFDPSDNHWHVTNTKVDDTLIVSELSFDSDNMTPYKITLSGVSGTVSDSDYAKLDSSDAALIIVGNEYYYLADKQSTFKVYTHASNGGTSDYYIKCVNINTTTKGWELNRIKVQSAAETVGYHATVSGLGSSATSSVTFTKDTDFPTTFEDVIIGGNTFVKIPTMYRKINAFSDGQITGFTVSTKQDDISYIPYPCFVRADNTIAPYVLIGKWCMSSTTTANSVDADAVSMTIGAGRTLAQALGSGYQLYDWQLQKLYVDLCLVISQNVNFNSGQGVSEYLGVKHLANAIWIDGIAKDTNDNLLVAYNPTNYVNSPTSSSTGYNQISYAPRSAEGWITKLGYDTNNEFLNYPTNLEDITGSASTYYCDYYYTASGSHPVFSNVGTASTFAGLWYTVLNDVWSSAFGVRLCLIP